MKAARVTARANIALAKYWGKANVEDNLPAVPSLSLTLDGLATRTTVHFDPALAADQIELDRKPASGKAEQRVVQLLDRMRRLSGEEARARVVSTNAFPTAAGLASSASGFAALVAACNAALDLGLSAAEQSAQSRRCSASAARSHFSGFVELRAGAETAAQVAAGTHWPLRLLVAVTKVGPKSHGSTDAMEHTRRSSPYYPAWVNSAPPLFERCRQAVLERDFDGLGQAMEQSTLLMHASMLAAAPAVIYFEPATLAVLHRVRALRDEGLSAYFTMDAGPHVKVLCRSEQAEPLRKLLLETAGVQQVIDCGPGEAPEVEAVGLDAVRKLEADSQ